MTVSWSRPTVVLVGISFVEEIIWPENCRKKDIAIVAGYYLTLNAIKQSRITICLAGYALRNFTDTCSYSTTPRSTGIFRGIFFCHFFHPRCCDQCVITKWRHVTFVCRSTWQCCACFRSSELFINTTDSINQFESICQETTMISKGFQPCLAAEYESTGDKL